MADTLYAWSKILYGVELNDDKSVRKVLSVEVGDTVTASKLKLNDDQFNELVESGAVRDYPFPEELQDPLASPNQLIAQGLADADTMAGTYGVSPELVSAYIEQQKKLQKPVKSEVTK